MVSVVPKTEEWLWKHAYQTKVHSASALRDRFQFLISLGAVLRSESLYKADLCDLCDFFIDTKQSGEPDPYHIGVLRIGEGKQNSNKVK